MHFNGRTADPDNIELTFLFTSRGTVGKQGCPPELVKFWNLQF